MLEYNTTRYAGCGFYIKIAHPTNNDRDAEVILFITFEYNLVYIQCTLSILVKLSLYIYF
jgi:hypothetical protein